MATASANSNSKIEDERKAAEKAKSTPHPTNARARTDLIISVLRTAVNNAATATPAPPLRLSTNYVATRRNPSPAGWRTGNEVGVEFSAPHCKTDQHSWCASSLDMRLQTRTCEDGSGALRDNDARESVTVLPFRSLAGDVRY
jgi:hypothetical protein